MSRSNEKKSRQLGMPHGTASGKLRKQIMFHLMQKCGMDTCHQCGKKIESIDTLSIEHKTPWLDSEDPVGLFFDTDNIAFSHHHCNCASARQPQKGQVPKCGTLWAYKKGCRCDECRKANTNYLRQYRKNT